MYYFFSIYGPRIVQDGSESREEDVNPHISNLVQNLFDHIEISTTTTSPRQQQQQQQRPLTLSQIAQHTTLEVYHSSTNQENEMVLEEQNQVQCAICHCDIHQGSIVRKLNVCGHYFHQGCIDTWLVHHTSCPICRRSIVPSSS